MEESERSGRRELDIFLPGMINTYGERGRFPAISITGKACALSCKHCKGYLLNDMIPVYSPDMLIDVLHRLEDDGMIGALLSGGCDRNGMLPWERFIPVLRGSDTSLYLIAHGGINLQKEHAAGLKNSGIKQVLIDVIGDRKTLKEIYNISSFRVMENTVFNAYKYGPDVAPHVIVGLYFGKIRGEYDALDMIAEYQRRNVILVVLMPTVLKVEPPEMNEVIRVFEYAADKFDNVTLGCARPKGKYRRELERELIQRGLIRKMALWSDVALETAKRSGIKVNFYEGCCSIDLNVKLPVT